MKELITTFPLSSVKSCCETLLRVMTLSHMVRRHDFFEWFSGHGWVHIAMVVLKCGVVHKIFFFLVCKASDGRGDAGFSQTLQWKTKPLLHVCRAQCADYHGKSDTHAASHTLIFIQGCFFPGLFNSYFNFYPYFFLSARLCMTISLVKMTCSQC